MSVVELSEKRFNTFIKRIELMTPAQLRVEFAVIKDRHGAASDPTESEILLGQLGAIALMNRTPGKDF